MTGGELKDIKALRLCFTVQNYEWGRHGGAGEVGRLYSFISKSPPEQDKPYAELWMGTHDSGQSLVEENNEKMGLKSWSQEHPEALGEKVPERWGIDPPFLFKVLSVGKALSIQAHPDKHLARVLHEAQPKVYKDSNHKPEMALALTEFEALCGFVCAQVRDWTPKEQLVLRLEKQYPDDIGVISAFLFNYVKLAPGEALYLDANEPHAYLYGECVECMATSDNVVRAGLTPKYRDVETLCSMLTYKQGLPEILQGVPLNPFTTRYSPPFYEFEVDRCALPPSTTVTFQAVSGPSIFLILYGEGVMRQKILNDESITSIQEGDVFFVPAGIHLEFSSVVDENIEANRARSPLHLYRAGINSRVFD